MVSHVHNHFPEFANTARLQIYDLPKEATFSLEDRKHQERDLHVFCTGRYRRIWEAKDVEEFKRIFIDCVECHFHAYTTGCIAHRGIGEIDLMIYQPDKVKSENQKYIKKDGNACGKKDNISEAVQSRPDSDQQPHARGILIDHDIEVVLSQDNQPNSVSAVEYHTSPFTARDLLWTTKQRRRLLEFYPTLPTVHLYRYDLESFFYILIWAATRYDLTKGKRCSLPPNSLLLRWSSDVLETAYTTKWLNEPQFQLLEFDIRPEWKDLWKKWIKPLGIMFRDGLACCDRSLNSMDDTSDFINGGGRLTFEKFMATIGVTPRKFNSKQ